MLVPHRSRFAVLLLLAAGALAATACTGSPEATAPPAELTADQAADALDGPPGKDVPPASQDGPDLVIPEEFARRCETWTGDLDGIVKRRLLRVLVTYNSTFYFVDRGRQGGITYEIFGLLEKELNRRFKKGNLQLDVLIIPVTRDRLIPALVEGHGDIAAANLTVTEGRQEQVAFSEPMGRDVKEIVVTGPGAPPINRLEDLSGQKVYVRASSSFAESLEDLNASLKRQGLAPVEIVPADERLETEDILDMVNAGVYPITIADDHLARFWAQVLDDIQTHPEVAVRTGTSIAWAMRKTSPKLKGFVDEFVRKNRAGTLMGNVILNRYLKRADWIKNPSNERDLERFRSMVDLFQKYGNQYDFNWLLVVAQAYQESGLDHSKRSPAGAIGVMQLLPSTARDANVGIPDIHILEKNIHAGVKYMRFILDRYYKDADMDDVDRHLFAFASYNAGPARIAGLRAQAERMGLDPNRWRGHVEVVAAREIGRETVQYVANILKYYWAYRLVTERSLGKSAAKQRAGA